MFGRNWCLILGTWAATGFLCVCGISLLGIIDNSIELMKTSDEDRNGKAKDKDSKECAQTGNYPSSISKGNLVAIANLN